MSRFVPRIGLGLGLGLMLSVAEAREVRLVVSGDCPTAAQLEAALVRAAPDSRIVSGAGDALVLRVIDRGASYHAVVEGSAEREFTDEERACEERARTAAVFASLALDMAQPAPRALSPVPSPPLTVELSAAGLVALAPGAGDSMPITGGGGLRLALERGRFGAVIGAAALAPATVPLDGVQASLMRVPLDLSARARLEAGPLWLVGELGVVMDVLVGHGEQLAAPRTDAGVVGGLRLGLELRWPRRRLTSLFGIEAAVFPLPQEFVVGGRAAGHAPLFWLSLRVGAALSIR